MNAKDASMCQAYMGYAGKQLNRECSCSYKTCPQAHMSDTDELFRRGSAGASCCLFWLAGFCGKLQGASGHTDVGCCVKQQHDQMHFVSHAFLI